MYNLGISICILLMSGCASGEEFEKFYGEWRVEKNVIFENTTGETEEEYYDRLRSEKYCLKSIFAIDSAGIRVAHHACYFLGCEKQYLKPIYKTVKIVEDNEYTLEEMGDEMVDSDIVGRKFVWQLDSTYTKPTLSFFDTKCSVDYGNSTLKICIISEDKIALYQGFNLIVLSRKR
jgi:hypothetical protein